MRVQLRNRAWRMISGIYANDSNKSDQLFCIHCVRRCHILVLSTNTFYKVNHDLGESAFKLGEEYRDFRSLVDLCHATPPIYPPQENVHASRIQEFVDKYKEEFTNELYDWYMEHCMSLTFERNPYEMLIYVLQPNFGAFMRKAIRMAHTSTPTSSRNLSQPFLGFTTSPRMTGERLLTPCWSNPLMLTSLMSNMSVLLTNKHLLFLITHEILKGDSEHRKTLAARSFA